MILRNGRRHSRKHSSNSQFTRSKTELHMKAEITYVVSEKLLAALTTRSLTYIAQSGFLKVEAAKGRLIYIANTKRVGRVDISGFEVSASIGKTPHCGPFGKVKQQLRMDGTEADVLARFELLLTELLAQPPVVKEVKAKPAPKAKSPSSPEAPAGAASSIGTVAPEPTPAEKRTLRLAAIAKVRALAEKMNQPLSSKLLAEEATLLAEQADAPADAILAANPVVEA